MWVVAIIGKGRAAYRTYSYSDAKAYCDNIKVEHPELNVFLCVEEDQIQDAVNLAVRGM